jgi:hypothetical protein
MAIAPNQTANRFELQCDDVQVTYSTSSFAGPPQLSYSGPEGDLSFSGSEIETQPTALGDEVTVTLETVPDLHTIALTLVLPSIRLAEDGDADVDTLAIKTTHHTTIAGPPAGAAQSYEPIALRGVAKSVAF